MAISDNALIQATRGTVFLAPAKTGLPTAGVGAFLLNAGAISVGANVSWDNLGHTSNSNKIGFSKDGGDTTTKDTWLKASAKSSTEAPTITITGSSVQGDKATLKKITGGWDGNGGGVVVPVKSVVQKYAMFVLAYDDGDNLSFGLYVPEADFTFNTIDLTGDDFAEFSFNAVVLSSESLKKGPNGEIGGYQLFSPEDFTTSTGK
ncbi:hypothetical protein [Bifidobacterium sp. SO1]|uniref:phage tail tube protein n=1 Tax=Bifidobacterium sp. SO1 TaxID=2809029 RepID=UPI001BDCFFA7|nr:hypothetical protein [Bifidobacterium sp. SO1]MBT1161208.1 hypothetical protein [Bifidobacterium sp. SO1]